MEPEDERENDTPPAAPAVVVHATPPADEPDEEGDESEDEAEGARIAAEIAGRIDALEARITEGLAGERQWTTTTISSLTQELADLKATLATIPEGLQSLREELTRLSRELAEAKAQLMPPAEPEAIAEVTPPAEPPQPPLPENADADGQATPNAPPVVKRRRRVV